MSEGELGDFEKNPDGAIDNDFDDAERSPRDQLLERLAEVGAPTHAELARGDIAFDLINRQPLYIIDKVADSLVEHFEQSDDDFVLATYNEHPWLPVRIDDPVFSCVFIGGIDGLHSFSQTYDYPAGRLARCPIELVEEVRD